PDPEHTQILAGDESGHIQLRSLVSGELLGEVSLPKSDAVTDVAFSPNGEQFAAVGRTGAAALYDARTFQPLPLQFPDRTPEKGKPFGLNMVRFSSDGKRVVTASLNGYADVFEAATGKFMQQFKHYKNVASAEFAPGDSSQVLTGCFDKFARVWS